MIALGKSKKVQVITPWDLTFLLLGVAAQMGKLLGGGKYGCLFCLFVHMKFAVGALGGGEGGGGKRRKREFLSSVA
jgi:hypothetical protein